MTIQLLAAVLQELYYNGRPNISKRLDERDFVQLVKMAAGSMMRKLYYEEKREGRHYSFCGAQAEPRVFELTDKDANGRRYITIYDTDEVEGTSGVLRLPHDSGILLITAVGDYPGIEIARSEAGSDWLYSGKEFEGQAFWTLSGKRVRFRNLPDCVKKVEVDGVWDDAQMNIPTDIAFDMLIMILGPILKLIDVPVDKTNNDDPNVQMIRQKLSPF